MLLWALAFASDPIVTEPDVAEPVVAEPVVAEPVVAEPFEPDSLVIRSVVTESILAQIAAGVPIAEAIVVDGKVQDWLGIYAMTHEGEVQEVAVAPTAKALAVRIRFGPGVDPLRPVFLGVDTSGDHPTDVSLRVNGSTVFVSYLKTRRWKPLNGAAAVRTGSVLELRLTWQQLIDGAPSDHDLRTEGPKSWVRVRAMLDKEGMERPVPLAVASYRLMDPAPPIEDRIPLTHVARVLGRLPVAGTWFIGQGAQSGVTHSGSWAYDLAVRDVSHRSRMGPGGPDQALAWGKELTSPFRGTVRSVENEQPDNQKRGEGADSLPNRVVLDLDNRTRLRMGHLMQGSVTVSVGDRVSQGQVVGRVGNSGKSSGPHVHVVYAGADGIPAPVRLESVRVGLNPSADDPWSRDMDVWEPRAGWFVTQLPQP